MENQTTPVTIQYALLAELSKTHSKKRALLGVRTRLKALEEKGYKANQEVQGVASNFISGLSDMDSEKSLYAARWKLREATQRVFKSLSADYRAQGLPTA